MPTTKKLTIQTKVTIAAVIVAVFAIAFGIGQHRQANMTAYAAENNCEWVYSDYIDRDPICK